MFVDAAESVSPDKLTLKNTKKNNCSTCCPASDADHEYLNYKYMDRTVFSIKEQRKAGGGDRFVPCRSLLRTEVSKHKLMAQQPPSASVFDDLTFSSGLNKRNYVKHLDRKFELSSSGQKILNFSDNEETQKIYSTNSPRKYPEYKTWPCRPRKKPIIVSADSILDLPNYAATVWNYELVDWSINNMLLAALGNKVYVWSWEKQKLVSSALANGIANGGKFNPTYPDTIAVALDSGAVETFTVDSGKQIWKEICHQGTGCTVTAIDWSPTGNSLVIGCSEGVLTVFDRNLTRVARRTRAHLTTVLRLRVSPDARFLASLGFNETSVSIWRWPHLRPYFLFENYSIVKSLAWHPWQSSMLAIGGSSPKLNNCVLAVWDVAPARLRQPTVKCSSTMAVDCMLFSQVTGEMVLSCWMEDAVMNPVTQQREPGSRIMVLSDPETEVDKWCMSDRVNTMMFSPDGSKLAIATADEDLMILYYLPEEPKWKKKNHRRNHSALAVLLDVAECGVSKR